MRYLIKIQDMAIVTVPKNNLNFVQESSIRKRTYDIELKSKYKIKVSNVIHLQIFCDKIYYAENKLFTTET